MAATTIRVQNEASQNEAFTGSGTCRNLDGMTLNEVIGILGSISRLACVPKITALKNSASVVIREDNCEIYSNGYVVYSNETGRTIMFIKDCRSYTYHFDRLTDAEKQYQKQEETVDGLGKLPWMTAITVCGDHRIENNSMNRTGSRYGSRTRETDDDICAESDGCWQGACRFPDPEEAVIRKETQEEKLNSLTEKQRKFYVLKHYYGYTQEEIAELYQEKRSSVQGVLRNAGRRLQKKK